MAAPSKRKTQRKRRNASSRRKAHRKQRNAETQAHGYKEEALTEHIEDDSASEVEAEKLNGHLPLDREQVAALCKLKSTAAEEEITAMEKQVADQARRLQALNKQDEDIAAGLRALDVQYKENQGALRRLHEMMESAMSGLPPVQDEERYQVLAQYRERLLRSVGSDKNEDETKGFDHLRLTDFDKWALDEYKVVSSRLQGLPGVEKA